MPRDGALLQKVVNMTYIDLNSPATTPEQVRERIALWRNFYAIRRAARAIRASANG